MLLGLLFHQVDTVCSDQRVHVRTKRMDGKFLTSTKCWQLRCLCVDFGLLSCQVSDGGPDHVYIMKVGRRDKNMSLRLLESSGRTLAIFPLHSLSQFPHSVGKIPFSARPACFSPAALPWLWFKVTPHTSAQVTVTVSLWSPLYLNRSEPA